MRSMLVSFFLGPNTITLTVDFRPSNHIVDIPARPIILCVSLDRYQSVTVSPRGMKPPGPNQPRALGPVCELGTSNRVPL